jgi:nucleoside diphosphate kinase
MAMHCGLVGEIISKCELAGFRIVTMKHVHPDPHKIFRHCSAMSTRDYMNDYYECSNAVLIICLAGHDVMQRSKHIISGVIHNYMLINNYLKETIEFINTQSANPKAGPDAICHGCDTQNEVEQKLRIWFSVDELTERPDQVMQATDELALSELRMDAQSYF